jgi:heme A synthase
MSKGLNRFAILVACATFFLIVAGALVTSNDAGLATEDWPLSNGQFFPEMVGNLFWEHGHRMVATTVGMLTIGLLIYILAKEKRRWVRRLGVAALLAVIAQGLLGGLTVKLLLPLAVSTAHATLAQLFFCITVSLAVFTSRSWMEARPLSKSLHDCARDDLFAINYRRDAAPFGDLERAPADRVDPGSHRRRASGDAGTRKRRDEHVAAS